MLERKKQLLLENYKQLKGMKWGLNKDLLLILASQYTGNEKSLDKNRIQEINLLLKGETGFFTALSPNVRICLAVLLDIRGDTVEEGVKMWKKNYQLLVNQKFSRGDFTYFAAYQLMLTPENEREQVITKAMTIFKLLRKQHFFLTSVEDYPAVVLLATLNEQVETVVERTKIFYQGLAKAGFAKGNELQFLANAFTYSSENADEIIGQTVYLKSQLTKRGVKVERPHYTSLGMLALLKGTEVDISAVVDLVSQLKKEKVLRWNKLLALPLAVDLVVRDKIKGSGMAHSDWLIAVETILQIQQANDIAATTAAVVVSSSNN